MPNGFQYVGLIYSATNSIWNQMSRIILNCNIIITTCHDACYFGRIFLNILSSNTPNFSLYNHKFIEHWHTHPSHPKYQAKENLHVSLHTVVQLSRHMAHLITPIPNHPSTCMETPSPGLWPLTPANSCLSRMTTCCSAYLHPGLVAPSL